MRISLFTHEGYQEMLRIVLTVGSNPAVSELQVWNQVRISIRMWSVRFKCIRKVGARRRCSGRIFIHVDDQLGNAVLYR